MTILGTPGQQDDGEGQRLEFILSKAEVTIGRAAASDIVLADNCASRTHARLECSTAGCVVVDAGSANGLKVNGRPTVRAGLVSGDNIAIGSTVLVFKQNDGEGGANDGAEELTRIDSSADLEATLCSGGVLTRIGESRGARLVVVTRSRVWEAALEGDSLSIGRTAGNDVVIDSPRASRRHARIERTGGGAGSGYLIRDLNSDNGTWVGGVRVPVHRLQDTDTIHIGGARLVFKAGYEEADLTVMESGTAAGRRDHTRRPVVIVPGFMGSNLWLGERRIWPNVRELFNIPDVMRYSPTDPHPMTVRGLVDELVFVPNVIKQEKYGGLVDYLEEAMGYERGKDVFEFAYDFRQGLTASARQLAKSIEEWAPRSPVTIIAHSMGALIGRYYANCLGGDRQVERLVLLGGPHFGSPKAILSLAVKTNHLPFGIMGNRIQEMLQTFPSMYHLLPERPCGIDQAGRPMDWLRDHTWLPQKHRGYLKVAADFRAAIGGPLRVPTLCVFGYGMKTLTGVHAQRDADGLCTRIDGVYEASGDGSVPESLAVLKGADIHPIQQYHGTLHTDHDVKKRLKIELTR